MTVVSECKKTVVFLRSNYRNVLRHLILILTATAFLFSDFRLGSFTFSDFILMAITGLLAVSGKIRITRQQGFWILVILSFLLLHVILHIQRPEIFSRTVVVTQSVKVLFYLTALLAIYNFIIERSLQASFLKISTILAVLSVLIGVYITIAIYSDGRLPYEFFWNFTRTHPTSFEFQGNPDIIRTRSLFSEPAHLGYYLLVILSANLFNTMKIKTGPLMLGTLIMGILFTLSYSMILALAVVLAYYFISHSLKNGFNWNKYHLIFIALVFLMGVIFWDFISVTLIDRSVRIVSGQDPSTTNRLLESWQYVDSSNILVGNGIGHTPVITNNFAYVLSDFGLIGFIPVMIFTGYLFHVNLPFAMLLVLLNMFRGGYLSAALWIVLLYFFVYSFKEKEMSIDRS